MLTIRVFGSKECNNCNALIDDLHKANIDFVFVDADADDTQDLCDEHDIDELPHVQILDNTGSVCLQSAGVDFFLVSLMMRKAGFETQ